MRLLPLVLIASLAAACGEDPSNPDLADEGAGGTGGTGAAGSGGGGSGGVGGSGGAVEQEPIAWGQCPSGGAGECTSIVVPLDWEDPEGQSVDFFVRRFPTDAAESKGQLWLLQGGPGYAGWSMNDLVPYFEALVPGFDIYIPDYRGVGYSSWLGCEGEPGGTIRASCANSIREAWGDGLAQFSTTGAALDIGHFIDRLRAPGEQVLLYGTSYGTFLLNRYLALFPDQADGVVLDSVCPPSGCDVRMDANYGKVAAHVFDLCKGDEFCSGKLGGDPWATMVDALDSLADGHCSDLYGYPDNRRILEYAILRVATFEQSAAVAPALAYRLQRCSDEDMAALDTAVRALFGGGMGFAFTGDESSEYLGYHVVISEFWPEGLDRAAAEAEVAALPLQMGALLGRLDVKESWTWPLYETPDELMTWSQTETPMLLLNGDLDGQTHLDGLAGVEESFQNEMQHFVAMPNGSHGVVFYSPMSSNNRNMTCGMELVARFFRSPRSPLDTACAEVEPAIDFVGNSAMARALFGTSDLWENAAASTLAIPPPLTETQQRILEELQRPLF